LPSNLIHAVAGEIGLVRSQTPKEQPPRKLSGKEDRDQQFQPLERGIQAMSADGITISGTQTEGAHQAG
jgi:hypothetical protein